MVTAQEFKEAWGEEADPEARLITYPREKLQGTSLDQVTKTFLETAGLPISAAPFLGFSPGDSETLERLSEVWDEPEASEFVTIGEDGNGDFIAVQESTGKIFIFNHDAGFERSLLNSSVPKLAETLVEFRSLVSNTLEINGPDAYLDNNIPASEIERFEKRLGEIDHEALRTPGFWTSTLESLKSGPY